MNFGFISVYIDDFTPCLKDNATREHTYEWTDEQL